MASRFRLDDQGRDLPPNNALAVLTQREQKWDAEAELDAALAKLGLSRADIQ